MPDDSDEETAAIQAAQMDADWPQAETGPDWRVNYPTKDWGNE